MNFRKYLPWWARIGAKLLLSNLPIPYFWWRKLSLFRHGDMNVPEPAIEKFRHHFDLANSARPLPAEFTALELGPGDSALSVVIARTWGASAAIALDAGDFAMRDMQAYLRTAEVLNRQGKKCPDLSDVRDFDGMLGRLNARYLTRGTASMAEIPDASIDYIWSCVVLEHVHRDEFARMAREMRRILKPGGVMAHSIDLRDHLGGGLNNLRVSAQRWESPFFRDAGFYTNRLGFRDLVGLFEKAEFAWKTAQIDRWPGPPLPRELMQPEFRERSDDDLCIAGFQLILWPADGTGKTAKHEP
jgi:SAM-dependent methyltransferase